MPLNKYDDTVIIHASEVPYSTIATIMCEVRTLMKTYQQLPPSELRKAVLKIHCSLQENTPELV